MPAEKPNDARFSWLSSEPGERGDSSDPSDPVDPVDPVDTAQPAEREAPEEPEHTPVVPVSPAELPAVFIVPERTRAEPRPRHAAPTGAEPPAAPADDTAPAAPAAAQAQPAGRRQLRRRGDILFLAGVGLAAVLLVVIAVLLSLA